MVEEEIVIRFGSRPLSSPHDLRQPRGRALPFLEPGELLPSNEPRGHWLTERDEPRAPAIGVWQSIEDVELAGVCRVRVSMDGHGTEMATSDHGLEAADQILRSQHDVEIGAVLRRGHRMREPCEALVEVSDERVGRKAFAIQMAGESTLEPPKRGRERLEHAGPIDA